MGIADFSRIQGSAEVFLVPKHIKVKPKPRGEAPQDVVVPRMRIQAIPSAMRQMGWTVSAALMDRWFTSPGWAMPDDWKTKEGQPMAGQIPASQLDTQLVSMEWAARYPRAIDAMRNLRAKCASGPTIGLLKKRLIDAGWCGVEGMELGRVGMTAPQLEDLCQVNIQPFGESSDTIDDMYGALGKATMKMAFVGAAGLSKSSGRKQFSLSHIGFYIRDNYDFNDEQFLGMWTEFGVLNKTEMAANVLLEGLALDWHGEPIGKASNNSFRDFRAHTGRGGDFVVYSDVLWQTVDAILDLS
ncbi:DUF6402 family protein [Luteibacter sp.]|uniref:DUF6402 family protein n=1 Tax=Luteibacter sp. TaxID=1886636 RepID=UPI002F3F5AFB